MSRSEVPPGDKMTATPAVSRTEPELREAILEQTARVRKLKVKPEIEEATRELVSLKVEFKTVTGSEWSDLREEGPILLTTNKVRGRDVLPEWKGLVKQLRSENIISIVCLFWNEFVPFRMNSFHYGMISFHIGTNSFQVFVEFDI